MRLTNFTFNGSIELGTSERPRFVDLHNIYGWHSLTHLPEQRCIRMSWTLPAGSRVQADLPPVVTLEFRGVSRFAASPHDPAMPYDEDTCLEAVTFAESERTSDKNECKVFRSDSGHVAFMFRSGLELKIWAEEAELIYDRNA